MRRFADRCDRRRLHVDRDGALAIEARECGRVGEQSVRSQQRSSRRRVAELSGSKLRAGREVDDEVRYDEIADRDAGSNATGDAHDDDMIDRGGIEDPLDRARGGADPDPGLHGDDLHPTDCSGVERVRAGSHPAQGEQPHEGE